MFGPAISAFRDNINALRDFVDVIEPVLHERTQAIWEQQAAHLAPLALFTKNLGWSISVDGHEIDDDTINQYLEQSQITVTITKESEKSGSLHVSGEGAPLFAEAVKSLLKTQGHTTLLYESSLISLSSMAEWFLAPLLHHHFEAHPEVVGTDKVFSFQDLQRLGSIEDARKSLIDSKVENILRTSFEDWLKFLKEQVKLSMGYLDTARTDRLVEFFQRRNLLVHNAGVMNSIYLSRVAAPFRKRWKIGDRIQVPRDYLDSAIAQVELNFLLIAAEFWKKLEPANQERSTLLNDIGFNHLLAERWEIAEGLSLFIKNDKQALESTQLSGRLNYWQALKWQNRFEEVRQEVEKADFSAKEPLFRLALAALRDDLDNFFELLPEILGSKKLYAEQLDSWPIFRAVRATEQYALFRAQRKVLPAAEVAPQGDEQPPERRGPGAAA